MMKIRTRIASIAVALLAGCLGTPMLHAQTNYNLTVKSGPSRQSFEGFGVCSISNWGSYNTTLRAQAADMVYRDLKMNAMRMWIGTTTVSSGTQALISPADMLAQFNTWYIASGFLNDVTSRGISTFLLGPYQTAVNGSLVAPSSISDYASNLAELILQLKTTYNVQIGVTGISNEPGAWTGAQMAECVNDLRSALDSRGLTCVKIVAPESSFAAYGGSGMYQIDGMLADDTAWENLYGIASHSYGPLGDHEFENRKLDKQWWITEAGGNGMPVTEYPEDESFASWILEIFLNNMNHGVTEWLHFNGPKQVSDFWGYKTGDPTHLVVIDAKTLTLIPYLQYYYFKQSLSAFDTGAVFRQCLSDTESDMLRNNTTGQNPALNAAAAYNPDGSWGINIINTTGVTGTTATSTNLFYSETTYNVNLTVEELANAGSVDFTIYRSRANNHMVQSGTLTLVNGAGTLSIAPRELVTLRSGSTALTVPPVPGGLTYSTVNDHLGLTWNNTVNAAHWNIKRATTSGGPYTTLAATAKTFYDDTSAANGTIYYYVVSAVNSLGESANSAELSATPAPFPWTNADIGNAAITGSCTVTDALNFTIWGSGSNINGTADSFNFTYVPMSGTGALIARLSGPSQANTKVGIVMRETLDAAPKSTFLIYNFNSYWNQVQMYNRTVAGNSGSAIASTVSGNPMWLKLVRSGSSSFTGYASTDGTTWSTIGSATLAMGNNIYAGMAVCSCGTAQTIRGFFDNVSAPAVAPTGLKELSASSGQITLGWAASYGAASYNIKRATVSGGPYTAIGTVTSPTLNYADTTAASGTNYYYVVSAVNAAGESANSAQCQAWINTDLGAVGLAGNLAISSSGAFVTSGAGTNFGITSDAFNYTCQTMTGDGTMIARVVSVTNPLMGKVGILMQESLAAAPKMASVFYDCHYAYLQARTVFRFTENTGGSWTNSSVLGLPVWLKLVRSGNVFTGSASSDGTTWTTITTGTISMGSTIYVGLVDTSRNTSQLTTATFDNVSLTAP